MPANLYFTQYLRPDGRTRLIRIERPDSIVAVADAIQRHGFRFECEELSMGDISYTISDEHGDYAIYISSNQPGEVAKAVDKLISEFNIPKALKERECNRNPS